MGTKKKYIDSYVYTNVECGDYNTRTMEISQRIIELSHYQG